MIKLFQPSFLKFLISFLCLIIFFWSLVFQYWIFDFGATAFLQLLCKCQKQPLTNTAVFLLEIIISGFPGRFLAYVLKLTASFRSILLTIFSGYIHVFTHRHEQEKVKEEKEEKEDTEKSEEKKKPGKKKK